jgi:citrate lyase synthetase
VVTITGLLSCLERKLVQRPYQLLYHHLLLNGEVQHQALGGESGVYSADNYNKYAVLMAKSNSTRIQTYALKLMPVLECQC